MKVMSKLLLLSIIAMGALAVQQKTARADDCLEIGWIDGSGNWTWYHAWVDDYHENGRLHIKYDYHHGELEMKVSDVDKPDGSDVILFRGAWFEEHNTHHGKVFMKMERGHHHAKGFYTNDDSFDSQHYDLELRDCKNHY